MSNNEIDSHESSHIALLLFESVWKKSFELQRDEKISQEISLPRRAKKIEKLREREFAFKVEIV